MTSDDTEDELPPLPGWIPDGGPVWHSTIREYAQAVRAPLLARIQSLETELLHCRDTATKVEKAEARIAELEHEMSIMDDVHTETKAEVERLRELLAGAQKVMQHSSPSPGWVPDYDDALIRIDAAL